MRRFLKQSALATLKNSAVFALARQTAWRNRRLVILGYHGVSVEDEHEWNPQLYITPELLENRLRFLRRHGYNVISLSKGVEGLHSGDLPERSVVLTFDDGVLDFYKAAYPILKAYSFPSTVYLTTYYAEDNRPVLGITADYILWKQRHRTVTLTVVPGIGGTMDLGDPSVREAIMKAIRTHAEAAHLNADEKHDLLRRLSNETGFDFDRLCEKRILHVMAPGEARELAQAGVDFQLHTHRHRVPLDQALFRREILDNRERIEAITGRPCEHFCYPSGVYHQEFLPWLRALNVKSATTCDPDICSGADEPLLLPRLLDQSNISDVEFEGWCCGAAMWLRGFAGRPRAAA